MSGQIVKQSDVYKALWQAGLIESGNVSVTIAGDRYNPSLEPWDNETQEAMSYVDIYKHGEGLVSLGWSNNDDPLPKQPTYEELQEKLAEVVAAGDRLSHWAPAFAETDESTHDTCVEAMQDHYKWQEATKGLR